MNILSLRNKFHGKTIALIGNGPSLNMQDLEYLQSNSIMSYGVNKIFLAYPNTTWRPDFYSSSDHAIAKDIIASFDDYLPKYTFVPKSTFKYYSDDNANREKIYFVNHLSRSDEKYKRDFSLDVSEVSYGGYNVLYFALQVIYFLGFSKVIILGLDHNYSNSETLNIKETSHNGRMIVHLNGTNHFHPQYFTKGSTVGDVYLDESEHSFYMANMVFERSNRKILNCSRESKLSLIDKSKLEDEI